MEPAEARAILGLGPLSTLADAKVAYRRLAKLVHPDRVSELPEDQQATATETMARLNLALETLRLDAPSSAEPPPAAPKQEPGEEPAADPRTSQEPPHTSPPPPPRPPGGSTANSSAFSNNRAASQPGSRRGRAIVIPAVILLAGAAIAGLRYASSNPSAPSNPTAFTDVSQASASGASSAPETPTAAASATTAAAAPAPSATRERSASSTPTRPRTTSWIPAGFEQWSEDLAYKWARPESISCGDEPTTGGCWGLTVVTRDGCRYGVYITLDLFDSADRKIGTTYKLSADRLQPGARAKYILGDLTFGGKGQTARVSELRCS